MDDEEYEDDESCGEESEDEEINQRLLELKRMNAAGQQ